MGKRFVFVAMLSVILLACGGQSGNIIPEKNYSFRLPEHARVLRKEAYNGAFYDKNINTFQTPQLPLLSIVQANDCTIFLSFLVGGEREELLHKLAEKYKDHIVNSAQALESGVLIASLDSSRFIGYKIYTPLNCNKYLVSILGNSQKSVEQLIKADFITENTH